MINNIKSLYSKYSFLLKPFLFLFFVYFIASTSIIRANFNYIDDFGRAAYGYKSWGNTFSRYASDFLSTFIHADNYLTDVSPLPQLIALCIVALSGLLIYYIITDHSKKIPLYGLIATIPLGLSPYFLECLSYKYDAPYMALSILACIIPLLLRDHDGMTYSTFVIFGILIMCATYQASSGVFPMLVALLCFKDWNSGKPIKNIVKFLVLSTFDYIIALIIFKVLYMNSADTYVSTSILPISEIIPTSMQHFREYFLTIFSDFKKEWIIIIGLICIAYVYIAIRDTARNKIIAGLISIFTLLVMALLSFGVYPFLTFPLYLPRAMYGFGVFISLVSTSIVTAKKVYPAKIVCMALSWIFFVFCFTYGNALAAQSNYTDFRINLVIDDLNNLEVFNSDNIKTVQITGSIGQSPILRNMPQDYQILNRLVPIHFSDSSWFWGGYYFYYYYNIKNIKRDASVDLTTYDLPVLEDTMYHTIKGDTENILIELK